MKSKQLQSLNDLYLTTFFMQEFPHNEVFIESIITTPNQIGMGTDKVYYYGRLPEFSQVLRLFSKTKGTQVVPSGMLNRFDKYLFNGFYRLGIVTTELPDNSEDVVNPLDLTPLPPVTMSDIVSNIGLEITPFNDLVNESFEEITQSVVSETQTDILYPIKLLKITVI